MRLEKSQACAFVTFTPQVLPLTKVGAQSLACMARDETCGGVGLGKHGPKLLQSPARPGGPCPAAPPCGRVRALQYEVGGVQETTLAPNPQL